VAFGFPEAQQLLPHRHSLYVGNPIRPAILESTREEGIRVYGVAEDETVILIIGGSLGAPQMNANFLRSLEQLDSSLPMGIKLRVLWSVGERTCETFRPEIDGTALRRTQIGIFPYIENVGIAYQAADIVVSRAGASTIAEIAACGRPSVLVPSPYVKGRHQHKNAMYMVKEGAAYLVEENDIGGQYFLEVMKELITDVDKRRSMASRAKQLGKPQAARTLAQLIMEVSQKTA